MSTFEPWKATSTVSIASVIGWLLIKNFHGSNVFRMPMQLTICNVQHTAVIASVADVVPPRPLVANICCLHSLTWARAWKSSKQPGG